MARRGTLNKCALVVVALTLVSGEEDSTIRYVALGDSFTIGTSVEAVERWPNQLAARIPDLELVANLGVNGFTSGDVIDDELPALDAHDPEFVTLLIGVNDVVQGVPEAEYAVNVRQIVEALLERLPPDRIACVATPDYTKTPQGAAFGDPDRQSQRIERVNATLESVCEESGIAFVAATFAISQEAAHDPGLVAGDGLHPSGEQYGRWTDAMVPVIEDLLRD